MDLDRYLDDLHAQLASAADVGGDGVRSVVEQLSVSLDAGARLALLHALSDAASEISSELAPGSVDVRLRGRDPEFVVTPAPESTFAPPVVPVPTEAVDDAATTRTTLRLPDQLKARVERAAADEGVSVNAWLVRAVADALDPASPRPAHRPSRTGDAFTGWVR